MSKFHPLAQPCQNCRKKKTAHKRVLGVLLCPKMLSPKNPITTRLEDITYSPMLEPVVIQNAPPTELIGVQECL